MLNTTEHEIFSANEYENANNSRANFMLSWVEHEKSFITSGPVCHGLFALSLGVIGTSGPVYMQQTKEKKTWIWNYLDKQCKQTKA